MRKALAVALVVALFACPAFAADTARLPLVYDTSVLGVDYSTMQAWADAKIGDFVALERGQVLEIPAGTYSDFVEVTVNNTSADYFWCIKAADGATVTIAPTALGHVGNYVDAFNYTFAVWAPYTKIVGINVDWTGLAGVHDDWLKVAFLTHSDVPHVRIINCTAQNVTAPSYIGVGIAAFSAGTTDFGVINSGVSGCGYGIGLFNGVAGFLYNDTVKGCTTGYHANTSTPVAKNCLADSNTTDWSGTFTKTTCVDGTPTYASGTDFDLDAADTVALGQGTDLSADATWAYSYDLHDDTRPAAWSVGADDNSGASVGTAQIMFFW